MTSEERKAARERCDKATREPWTARKIAPAEPEEMEFDDGTKHTFWPEYSKYVDGVERFCAAYEVPEISTLGNGECGAMEFDNADFVAHARTDLPAALDALEAAERRIAELEAQ